MSILLCHGNGDEVVPYKFGEKSSRSLTSAGFQDATFKSYNELGHYTIPEEMDETLLFYEFCMRVRAMSSMKRIKYGVGGGNESNA